MPNKALKAFRDNLLYTINEAAMSQLSDSQIDANDQDDSLKSSHDDDESIDSDSLSISSQKVENQKLIFYGPKAFCGNEKMVSSTCPEIKVD